MTGCTCGNRGICVECVLAELGWTADDALAVLEDRFAVDAARGQARLEAVMAAGELTEREPARQVPDADGSASARSVRFDGGTMASDARSRVAPGEAHQLRPRSVSSPTVSPAFGNVVELHGWSRRVGT